ncbi:MAG TPA: DUF2784 domain-containing protein [Candidatus Paceibacterota bacterium]|nr:DUF2784 domain-containing protein [Verrucomicrobiota bacterium]HRY49606.1 DUF2784 domain-containing protein [Candidatus Paceibacterota bacterium]
MSNSVPYQFLADLVLIVHFAIVVFIIGGLVFIGVGGWRGWRLARLLWFRVMHLVAIAVVVAQVWLGKLCALTTLEMGLRTKAHETTYTGSFIEYWLDRLLFFEAPTWVFTLAYSAFGLAVLAAWWVFPPRSRSRAQSGDA